MQIFKQPLNLALPRLELGVLYTGSCGRTPKNVDLVFLFGKEGGITMTQKRIIKYILGYIKKPSIFGLLVILGVLIYQIYGCDLHDRPYVSDKVGSRW